jgi:hypothetical protein
MARMTKTQKKELVNGLSKLARAFVKGAAARKSKSRPVNTNLAGTPVEKPGCGPCGSRRK